MSWWGSHGVKYFFFFFFFFFTIRKNKHNNHTASRTPGNPRSKYAASSPSQIPAMTATTATPGIGRTGCRSYPRAWDVKQALITKGESSTDMVVESPWCSKVEGWLLLFCWEFLRKPTRWSKIHAGTTPSYWCLAGNEGMIHKHYQSHSPIPIHSLLSTSKPFIDHETIHIATKIPLMDEPFSNSWRTMSELSHLGWWVLVSIPMYKHFSELWSNTIHRYYWKSVKTHRKHHSAMIKKHNNNHNSACQTYNNT